ncbi:MULTISPECIES: DUF2934 domain-containing protein [Pseudomonas]|jgi:hypothetical protein|uniref:DUF2934 domain-containing protein n=2 Tax=Pseudomonas TaxID=286 RepID=A0A2X2CZC5_PSELU|nr:MULTISPECIES: DUF2934 domain-containing protein [Pseudomonas]AYN96399.1 DUF2934 domain-containing protein [Pseudomonas sp. LTJR-52]ENA29108.1 hypothetical protein HMPREF1487_08527 [Pseudomonas sp. HPB0071]MBA1245953.1 DUF2934 domain-containing protein [Pseudomonas zeshuii]MBF8642919.1 DUF2934 domain-containing protein [Pseudomonas zeshuii]MBH3440969.1 DUF2934 domain-containing protein [Pseudomonas luteola]
MDDLEQRIRQRAYEIWEAAGRPDGQGFEHWFQAQREVDYDTAGDPLSGGIETSVAQPMPKPKRSRTKKTA